MMTAFLKKIENPIAAMHRWFILTRQNQGVFGRTLNHSLNSVWATPAVIGSLSLLLLAVLVIWIQHRGKVVLRDRLKLVQTLMVGFDTSGSLEDNLNHVLAVIGERVKAPYYAFYLWDEPSARYMLRSVSHPYDLFEGVGPAYSGIALPKKEAYLPPSVVEVGEGGDPVSLTTEGEVPLFVVHIGQHLGLIRIGPLAHISRGQLKLLVDVSHWLVRPLEDCQTLEQERISLQLKTLADKAVTKIASMATNPMGSIEILLQAFTGLVGGVGALFVERTVNGIQVHASESLASIGRVFQLTPSLVERWHVHSTGVDERIISRRNPEFYELPLQITSRDDVGAVILVPFGSSGTLFLLQNQDFDEQIWTSLGQRQLHFLIQQVQRLTSQMPVQAAFMHGYTRLLCQMADFVDNLNPYTVGYSDMMTHYSLAIGKELGLLDNELQNLALAARLSNIGVIGMDTNLLVKEGRYTDFEYGVMKRHAEISASMIELVTGNRQAAEYVLCHHERVDGLGYPRGLVGEDIPRPAMVIHVVQVFLAKVNGRAWRTPLSFEMALKELRASTGTSLDKSVVEAFERWWLRQVKRSNRDGGNLGFCYEMCCVPKSICEACPAFKNPLRCWEMPENQCRHHGRDCSTCFVKTEYQYRMTLPM